ncbi:Major Facilitator Superfamily protein [Mucilaginibacter lappiensis]|uniref:MFS family permease n=1 Tax=Mucilaginibacter lappiensis TaxID=354630 RepID=A0ABR6PFV3_9SPHI|nr:MFS transporter [Mucilaginibacter lappiensis]MBB6108634.1 MFS family permease [Mucilaginibacter lappiensis]SIQ30053.1 Major Facilitator Superfamily protein [Mucilaginibacter lappiensis]
MRTFDNKGILRFMTPLVLGNMLNPLNSTMLATAIVPICSAFKQDIGTGALLIVPLYLTSAIGQPLMGRLADLFSAKKINLLGFILILISALIGVYAQNFIWLVVSRIVLGFGSSAAYPSSITLIRQRYRALNIEVPGKALGTIAIASQVSLAFGPFLGGILTENFGWKGIFFVNIPLVILALILSKNGTGIPEHKAPIKTSGQLIKELDLSGAFFFSAFLILFLLTLLYPTYLLLQLPLIMISLSLFIRTELRRAKPFINVRLLTTNLSLSITFMRQIAISFVMYLVLYGLPQWLEQSKNINPSKVGLMMLPLSFAAIITSLLVSKYKNYMRLLTFGTFNIVATSAVLFLMNTQSTNVIIIGTSMLLGIALGLLTIANQATLYAEAADDQVGVSFGLYRTVGYIGAIIAGSRLKHEFRTGATDSGLHVLAAYALVASGIIILFIIPALRKQWKNRTEKLETIN